MTIKFLKNTSINSKIYHTNSIYTLASADESTQVTAGNAIYELGQPVLDYPPKWFRVGVYSYTDFATAGTSKTLNMFNLEPRGIIEGIKIKHTVAFAGGSISAYTISVGDSTGNAVLASAFDVFQAFGSQTYQLSDNFYGEDNTSPTAITVTATSTSDNLNNATAGMVNIWALMSKSVI